MTNLISLDGIIFRRSEEELNLNDDWWIRNYPKFGSYMVKNKICKFTLYSNSYKEIGKNKIFNFISEKYKEKYLFIIEHRGTPNDHCLFFFEINQIDKVYFHYFDNKKLNFFSEEFITFFQNHLLLK